MTDSEPKQTYAFRFDQADLEILAEVQRRTGLGSRSDAARYVLRQYAQEHEFAGWGPAKVVKTSAKPPTRKRK